MLNDNLENRGIYGYSKSKEKKRMETILDSMPGKGIESADAFVPSEGLAEVGTTLDRVNSTVDVLGNKEQRSEFHRNIARENLVPTDTEQRRRRQFVLSDNVIDDAVDEYYQNRVLPEFTQQRQSAEDRASGIFRENAAVPGADPLATIGAARNAADPARVIGNTMERLDNDELNRIADAYARYGGLDTDAYRKHVLEPNLQNRMYGDYVKRSTPTGSLEYIGRGIVDNSVTGKAIKWGIDKFAQSDTQTKIDREGMANYNAGRAENFAAGVGSLLLDTGVFAGFGGLARGAVGKSTSMITKGLTSRLAARGASRGLTGEVAARIVDRNFLQTLGARIAQSGSAQGLTLGAYDATNSVVDDLLYGEGITAGKVAGAFGKGFGTGMALGVVGTPLRQAAKGLTGGKKVLASAGVLSAESAVFTLGVEAEKLAAGVEVEPIDLLGDFGESAATLLTMRMAHWRPRGAQQKLNADGRLKPELSFNHLEQQEMRSAGVNPGEFISHVEQALNPRYGGLRGVSRNNFISNYENLMSSENLSASTRSKLLYIVENKMTSTPPVGVDCSINTTDAGIVVDIKDNFGRRVERRPFADRSEAEAFVDRNSGALRRNRIASLEEGLRRSIDSENFFRQAGEYARETGVDVNEISNAMYRKAQGKSLSSRDMQLLDDIMYRSSYSDAEHGNVMHSIRMGIEQKYGLPKGTLLTSIDKRVSECSEAENSALAEYEAEVRSQSDKMQQGVSPEMHADAQRLIAENGLEGYSDDQIRNYEQRYNRSVAMRPSQGNPDLMSSYRIFRPNEYEYVKEHGFPYPADGEPRINRGGAYNPTPMHMYSHDDLARMAVKARDVAKKLNTDIKLVYDVHEHDYNDPLSGFKVSSKGWHDAKSNDVVVNLAQNENVDDVNFTVVHEIVGHKGFDNLFGKAYEDMLGEMYFRLTPEVQAQVRRVQRESYANVEQALDEYLARMTETLDQTPAERSMMRQMKYFLQSSLNRIGVPIRDIDENRLRMLLQQHRKAIENRMPAKQHRQSVFGSFRSSHLDDSQYESAYGEGSAMMRNRFRFIGEKGAANLKNLKKNKFSSDLSTAKYLNRKKSDAARIKRSTGWEIGADGKWRFEIDDSGMEVNYYPDLKLSREHPKLFDIYKKVRYGEPIQWTSSMEGQLKKIKSLLGKYEREGVKLPDAVPDDILYDAYPEFKDINVVYRNMGRGLSKYLPREKTLYINSQAIGTNALNKSVAMEMQKMIQAYEGFSQGYPLKPFLSDELYHQVNEPLIHTLDARSPGNHYYDGDNGRRIKGLLRENYGIENINEVPGDPDKFDDFRLSMIRATPSAQSGNVEVRNVGERFDYSEDERKIPSMYTESISRERQVSPNSVGDLYMMLKGPLDIIKEMGLWKYYRSNKGKFNDRGLYMDGKDTENPKGWNDYIRIFGYNDD